MTSLPSLPPRVRKLTEDDAALAAIIIVQNTGTDLVSALKSLGFSLVATDYLNNLTRVEADYAMALHTPKSQGGLSET